MIKYTKSSEGSLSDGTTSKPWRANGTEEGKPVSLRRVIVDVAGSYVATWSVRDLADTLKKPTLGSQTVRLIGVEQAKYRTPEA